MDDKRNSYDLDTFLDYFSVDYYETTKYLDLKNKLERYYKKQIQKYWLMICQSEEVAFKIMKMIKIINKIFFSIVNSEKEDEEKVNEFIRIFDYDIVEVKLKLTGIFKFGWKIEPISPLSMSGKQVIVKSNKLIDKLIAEDNRRKKGCLIMFFF